MLRAKRAEHARSEPPAVAEPKRQPGADGARDVLALQGAVGNRAVTRLLARDDRIKLKPPPKPPPRSTGFTGDGHRPTDATYAAELGRADAARLSAASAREEDAVRADINAKLAWFRGAAHAAYLAEVTPELTAIDAMRKDRRDKLRTRIVAQNSYIKDLKHERINAWEKNAKLPEADWGAAVLEIAILIVSEGFGGIAYLATEKLLKRAKVGSEYVKHFGELAGLEIGDLATEKALHSTVEALQSSFEASRKQAEKHIRESARQALATKKGDTIGAFVEAMRLHAIEEQKHNDHAFTEPSLSHSEQFLREWSAGLEVTYQELSNQPEKYLQELSVGYIRLLDEARMQAGDKEHGGDRDRTWREDRGAHSVFYRPGNVVVSPVPDDFSIGHWHHPDFGFTGLELSATGANTETLEDLIGTKMADLKTTTAVHVKVYGAIQPLIGTQYDWLEFAVDPNGRVHVDLNAHEMEWLASYYRWSNDEYSSEERERYAPLGALKLFAAIQDKPILKVSHKRPFGDQ